MQTCVSVRSLAASMRAILILNLFIADPRRRPSRRTYEWCAPMAVWASELGAVKQGRQATAIGRAAAAEWIVAAFRAGDRDQSAIIDRAMASLASRSAFKRAVFSRVTRA